MIKISAKASDRADIDAAANEVIKSGEIEIVPEAFEKEKDLLLLAMCYLAIGKMMQ